MAKKTSKNSKKTGKKTTQKIAAANKPKQPQSPIITESPPHLTTQKNEDTLFIPQVPQQEDMDKGDEAGDFYLPLPEYDDRYRYAGLYRRMLALNIDLVIFLCVVLPINALLEGLGMIRWQSPSTGFDANFITLALAQLGAFGVVHGIMHYYLTTSLGKILLGMRVVKASNGQKPSLIVFLLRHTVGYMVSAMPVGLGFIMAGVSFKKRALHDHVFGTLVIIDGDYLKRAYSRIKAILMWVLNKIRS